MRARGDGRPAVVVAVALVGVLAGVLAGCGDDEEARFRAAEEAARTSTTTIAPVTEAPLGAGTGEPSATAVPDTTTTAPTDPGTALLTAVDALRAAGPGAALRFTTHFPVGSGAYASLQSQDPANPANVDERDWRDGKVSQPEPVRLTPADDLAVRARHPPPLGQRHGADGRRAPQRDLRVPVLAGDVRVDVLDRDPGVPGQEVPQP